jgi:hypothetical protein
MQVVIPLVQEGVGNNGVVGGLGVNETIKVEEIRVRGGLKVDKEESGMGSAMQNTKQRNSINKDKDENA